MKPNEPAAQRINEQDQQAAAALDVIRREWEGIHSRALAQQAAAALRVEALWDEWAEIIAGSPENENQ